MSLCDCGSPYCQGCPATETLKEKVADLTQKLESASGEIVRLGGDNERMRMEVERLKALVEDHKRGVTDPQLWAANAECVKAMQERDFAVLQNNAFRMALVFIGTADPSDVMNSFWKMRKAANDAIEGAENRIHVHGSDCGCDQLDPPKSAEKTKCGKWEPGFGPCVAEVPCKAHGADKRKNDHPANCVCKFCGPVH